MTFRHFNPDYVWYPTYAPGKFTYSRAVLHEFLIANKAELIDLCRSKVALRRAFVARDAKLESGIPQFFEQLVKTLEMEQTADPMRSRRVSGPSGGGPAASEIGATAARHGRELLQHGYTIEQVVHDYGDLCQAITDMACEHESPIQVGEFRTLNRCLDNAIADAVKEFGYQRDVTFADEGVRALNERMGILAHELRNSIHTASLAVAALKTGFVGTGGATGGVLDRSLAGMRTLIDRALADVRVAAGMPARHKLISLAEFIGEVELAASLEARTMKCSFTVAAVDPKLGIEADRDLLFSAVGNLLQNAFKFTHSHSEVSLNARSSANRVLIEVEDHCGGLPPGDAEKMFAPFAQGGTNKSGLGLGLAICQRSVEANMGVLSVRDLPGSGCVFTIDLPRHLLPEPATV